MNAVAITICPPGPVTGAATAGVWVPSHKREKKARPTGPRAPRARSTDNERYADDGSLESVQHLLEGMAGKAYLRVQALGLVMEHADCVAIFNEAYVRARRCWNPDHEAKARFSTYLTRSAWNFFNDAIEKAARERVTMGMVSYHDPRVGSDSDRSRDPMETMMGATCPGLTPEQAMDRAQQVPERLRNLSPGARKLAINLIAWNERQDTPPPRLGDLAKLCGLAGAELKRVKLEILTTFGVKF